MKPENNETSVIVTEQKVAKEVESDNIGIKPQGSATPDSNVSAKEADTRGVPITSVPIGDISSGTASSGTVLSGTALKNPYLAMWDGTALLEGVLYNRNNMLGLKECYIKENRDSLGRAVKWQNRCRAVGMAQPAKYVGARVAKAAGYTLVIYNPKTGSFEELPDALLDFYYVVMDGNGRREGHNLDLEEAKKDPTYKPFDFPFFYEDIRDPKLFQQQFVSINFDVEKPSNAQLISYAVTVYNDPSAKLYNKLQKEGFVVKAAAHYVYGKELSREDVTKINKGQAVSVDTDLVSYMQEALELYQGIFVGNASARVLKGVPLARWTCNKFRQAEDKDEVLQQISRAFSAIDPKGIAELQDARGVRGDKTMTTEIVLCTLFDKIFYS